MDELDTLGLDKDEEIRTEETTTAQEEMEIENQEENKNKQETNENQRNADYKLSIFQKLPIKHKCITAQPLIENIEIEKYLDGIELVVVGGESDINARPLHYDWVLNIRKQCVNKNVSFEFRQCGTYFVKDGKEYKIQTKDLTRQAKLANINFVGNE